MPASSGLEPRIADPDSLDRLLVNYRRKRRPIRVNFRALVTWPSYPERATHLIHPYPAKLLAHIPFFFLASDSLSEPDDIVLDPFCGSGTVLLEAVLAGRHAIGADANPLARLIATVKSCGYDPHSLRSTAERLVAAIPAKTRLASPDVVNLDHWFYPHVTKQLLRIRHALQLFPDSPVREFFQVCFSVCVRRVSLADPRLSVPVRLNKRQYSEDHWLHSKVHERLNRLRRINVIKEFDRIVQANLARVDSLAAHRLSRTHAHVLCADARDLKADCSGVVPAGRRVRTGSVQLVITSPPYAGAQKYVRASSLSLGWLDLCPVSRLRTLEDKVIGREHFSKHAYRELSTTGIRSADHLLSRIWKTNPLRAHIAATYLDEIRSVFTEVLRVLAPGGHLVLVAGNNNVCGREFQTAQFLKIMLEELGFVTALELLDDIKSRGLMTKRNRTAGVIAQEWVFLFQKPK